MDQWTYDSMSTSANTGHLEDFASAWEDCSAIKPNAKLIRKAFVDASFGPGHRWPGSSLECADDSCLEIPESSLGELFGAAEPSEGAGLNNQLQQICLDTAKDQHFKEGKQGKCQSATGHEQNIAKDCNAQRRAKHGQYYFNPCFRNSRLEGNR